MQKISDHITYREATRSNTAERNGIDNNPNSDQILNMIEIAENVFEPTRKGLGGNPIGITSFFRSPVLNTRIGGSTRSQHCKGEAMDLDTLHANKEIARYIIDNLDFDQVIIEFPDEDKYPKWIHVSYKRTGENRKQVLMSFRDNDRTQYLKLDDHAINKLLG